MGEPFQRFINVKGMEEMMKRTLLIGLGCVGVLLSSVMLSAGQAGVIIEEIHRDREGRTGRIIRYYSGDQFRTDHLEGAMSTIIDFRGDRMVMIDHSSRTYVETKFSQWEKEVSEKLKKTMPEIRTRERKITVTRTGEKARIQGFQTEKIEIRADGELIEENWMTRDVDVREVERVMEKVAKSFSKEFKVEMKEGREIYEKLKAYGIPILVKDYSLTYGLGPITVVEVRRLEKKDLGSEVFLPPPSYQRIIPEGPKR